MSRRQSLSSQEYADSLDLPHVFTPFDKIPTEMFDWPRNRIQEENLSYLQHLLNEFAGQILLPFDNYRASIKSHDNPNLDDRVTEVVMTLLEDLRVSEPDLNIQGFWSVSANSRLDYFLVDIVVLCGDVSELWLVPLQLTSNYSRAIKKMSMIQDVYGSSHVIPVVWSEMQGKIRLSDNLIKCRLRRALLLSKGKVRLKMEQNVLKLADD